MAEHLQVDSSKGVLELSSDLFEPKAFDARYQNIRYHTFTPVAPIEQSDANVEFHLPGKLLACSTPV
jgi:hypothetical protein